MEVVFVVCLPIVVGVVTLLLTFRGWRSVWRDRALLRALSQAPASTIAAARGRARVQARVRALSPFAVEDATASATLRGRQSFVIRDGYSQEMDRPQNFFRAGDEIVLLGSFLHADVDASYRDAPATDVSIDGTTSSPAVIVTGVPDLSGLLRRATIRCTARVTAAIFGMALILSVPITIVYLIRTTTIN